MLMDVENLPLVIDLDGTLVLDDTLEVMARRMMSTRPELAGIAALRLLRGRARLKHYLWQRYPLRREDVRWNDPLLDRLQHEVSKGRLIVLATGAPDPLARSLASGIPGIQEIIATTPNVNLTSHRKAAALVHRFGWRGFVYAGNSRADLAVWEAASGAWVCNATDALVAEASLRTAVLEVL
jgi:phosphoserine phosphatase